VAAVGQGGLALPLATGPRLLALHLPALPLQRLARGIEPAAGGGGGGPGRGSLDRGETAGGRPVAVVAEGRVVVCDAAARAAGIRPGDTQAQAMAACGALRAVAHAPAADLQALRGLAEALLAIGPAVEVVAPDALLLDAGAAHLLGGGTSVGRGTIEAERRLIAEARALAAGLGYAVRAAVASGRGPALALARHGAEASACVAPGREAQALAPLPLEALGLGPAVAERLAGVGVRSVGELARLPAEGLALRFGPAGAAAARLARGDDPSLLTPYLPETLPEEAIELEGVAESAEPVLFVLGRLAERVAARLGGRGLGASRLKLTLKLDPRGEERLLVPLARPSSAPERWLPTLRERLLALRLPGAVTGVRLTAVEVAACPAAQLAFGDRPEVAAALETVLARLGGRLGDGAVLSAEPVDRHRPEAAWRTGPFRPPRGGAGGSWGEGAGGAADGTEARRARPSPRQAREEASSAGVLQPYAEQHSDEAARQMPASFADQVSGPGRCAPARTGLPRPGRRPGSRRSRPGATPPRCSRASS